MLRLFIICSSTVLLFLSASAGENQLAMDKLAMTLTAVDTTLNKDSLLNDPKKGFSNLFEGSSMDGINTSELNPQAISFVNDYIRKQSKSMENLKSWGRPYFDMMDRILESYGLPKELKYLAVIESQLKSNAKSWAGAVGPWQFMPATARNYGLRVSRGFDERTDYTKSTHAASKYLSTLYEMYGDWLLVIAAYNGGPGNVNSAIRKSNSRDFWTLQRFLPAESRNHVKKFIATHYMMEGEGGHTTLTKDELAMVGGNLSGDEMANAATEEISGRFKAAVLVKHLEMTAAEFNKYNPGFDNKVGVDGSYALKLPVDKMKSFREKKNMIQQESVQWILSQASL